MSGRAHSEAAKIRARVGHPIVDADADWLEFGVVGLDELRRIGGERAAEGFAQSLTSPGTGGSARRSARRRRG